MDRPGEREVPPKAELGFELFNLRHIRVCMTEEGEAERPRWVVGHMG
jgi:hypothetical protein